MRLGHEQVHATKAIRHDFHYLDCEHGRFLHQKEEAPLVYRLNDAIRSRNRGGNSRLLINQTEFAKDAFGRDRLEGTVVDDDVHFSILDDVHLFSFVSLFEYDCPGRKRSSIRDIGKDIVKRHILNLNGLDCWFVFLQSEHYRPPQKADVSEADLQSGRPIVTIS
jgi:hypothetical protein